MIAKNRGLMALLSLAMTLGGCADVQGTAAERQSTDAVEPTTEEDAANSSGVDSSNLFEIESLTTGPLSDYFSKYTTVFGVTIMATQDTPDGKIRHAAAIMAEYLDNDEDGAVDDPAVVDSLVSENATLVMFATQHDAENSGIFESSALDGIGGQDLYAEETAPEGQFDAALEEVLHLISVYGYERVYPAALGSEPTTLLTEAMDLARGGHFTRIPPSYPDAAWYHYDDATCDYRCMAVEYFYWALTTKLGAQEDPDRCDEIRIEWELCTPTQLAAGDLAVYELLADPRYKLPTILPDGNYQGTVP